MPSEPTSNMVCPNCGREHAEPVNFCSGCGHRLADDPHTGVMPVVHMEPGGPLHLLVVGGPNAGSTYAMDTPVVTIGRHPDSDVFLEDITVSRRHAELRLGDDGGWTIADAGSLNGTYIDDERVDVAPVGEGSRIQVGRFKLVIIGGAGQG